MVGKKGIIKIIEASIAILIIFIVILTFSMTKKASREIDLSEKITPLLEEIAKNNSLRDEIISYNPQNNTDANKSINTFLDSRLISESNLDYDFRICNLEDFEGCRLLKLPEGIVGNIYAGSRVISSSLTSNTPKRVRLFIWFIK